LLLMLFLLSSVRNRWTINTCNWASL
jgi:hypothetical protein